MLQLYQGEECLAPLRDLVDFVAEMGPDQEPGPNDPWWSHIVVRATAAFANPACFAMPDDDEMWVSICV